MEEDEPILGVEDEGEMWPVPSTLPADMLPLNPNFRSVPADLINHPPHYTFGQIEVIDVIEDWGLSFHQAQVLKYVARSKHKGNELEDLKKARFYIDRLIRNLEKK